MFAGGPKISRSPGSILSSRAGPDVRTYVRGRAGKFDFHGGESKVAILREEIRLSSLNMKSHWGAGG